jgi:hypothetical protein
MDILSESQQDEVLDLEIGDIVQVKFTPSGIPPAIEQYVRIIGISHDWQNNEKRINLALVDSLYADSHKPDLRQRNYYSKIRRYWQSAFCNNYSYKRFNYIIR